MPARSRSALLAQLGRGLDTATAGHGRVFVVRGEAGIGKTTLVRAATADRGDRVLWGGCEPLASTRPLLPLHDWARALGGEIAAAVAGDDARHDLFQLALDQLGRAPTVAVVEDVHWADDATLDLLVFLARRITHLPVALVVTVRDDEPAPDPRVPRLLSHLAAAEGPLVVPPLTPEEVAEITAGSGLDAGHVHHVTGGNAYFVTALVGSPTESVPSTVREAVMARVAQLSDAARRAVETLAVVPDRAGLELVYGAGPATPADVEEAERAGLLVSDGHTVAFRHALAREAVEASLPGSRRRERHVAVLARLLDDPSHPEAAIAHHADQAGDHALAVEHGLAAAGRAQRLGAHHEALVQLSRAAEHVDHVPAQQAITVLRELRSAQRVCGDTAGALATADRALGLAREIADPSTLAEAQAARAGTLWGLGRGAEARAALVEAAAYGEQAPVSSGNLAVLLYRSKLRMLGRETDGAMADGRAAAELARTLGDEVHLADALHVVGAVSWFVRPDEAEPLLVDALERAEQLRDDSVASIIMVNLGSGAGEIRWYDVASRWLDRAVAFATARDLDAAADYATAWLARIALEVGDFARAGALASSVREGAEVISRIGALTVLGRLGVRLGRPDAADHLRAAWALAEPTGDLQRLWPVAAGLSEEAWAAGAPLPRAVAGVFEQAVSLAQPWAVGELGWWLVREGLVRRDDVRLEGAAPPYRAIVEGRWEDAAALWDELGCPYDAALARLESGEPGPVTTALTALDRLGCRTDGDRAAARLRELGAPVPRRPRGSTAAHPDGLTDRELEVLSLLRDGLTNAEIAGRMYISVKTAGHHVSSVLAKLGVSSRREAARR